MAMLGAPRWDQGDKDTLAGILALEPKEPPQDSVWDECPLFHKGLVPTGF